MADNLANRLLSTVDPETAGRLRRFPGNEEILGTLCSMLGGDAADRPFAFVGAGLSYPLPGWQVLLTQLGDFARRRGLADADEITSIEKAGGEDPLGAASQLFEKLGGKQLAFPLLKEMYQLPDDQPTEGHRLAMRIPFKGFVTTNYDLGLSYAWLVEYGAGTTLPKVGVHASPDDVRQWLDRRHFESAAPQILHLHGSVDQPGTMVLDEESYHLTYGKRGSAAGPTPFRRMFEDIWLKEKLVLLGFSGDDPMVRYLAHKTIRDFKWAGSPPQHIAILPLESHRIGEAAEIRRGFYRDFHAHVIFFDPTALDDRGNGYADLRTLLGALGECHPIMPVLRRRSRSLRDIETYKERAVTRLRKSLESMIPESDAQSCRDPVDEVFWLPGINQISSGRKASDGEEGDRHSVSSIQKRQSGAPANAVDGELRERPSGDEAVVDRSPSPSSPERIVAVVYGEAGTGKSVLSRLLAIALMEGTGLARVTDALPPEISGRDIPVMIDLKRHAADLLADIENPAVAIRQCIVGDWGLPAAKIIESPDFAERGLIIIDGLEALLWLDWGRVAEEADPDCGAFDACDVLLDEIQKICVRAPVVISTRQFARASLESIGLAATSYEIAPLTDEDFWAIAKVHLFGRRDAVIPDEDNRLDVLSRNREIRNFATTPIFVRIVLDILEHFENGTGLTRDRVMSRHFDRIIRRGMMDGDDHAPLSADALRDLLRAMAFKLTESGESILTQKELLACGREQGLRDTSIRRAVQWLGDRTEWIAADPDGGVSFAHDLYREWLAGGNLASIHSPTEFTALASMSRWREPVKYAIGRLDPKAAKRTLVQLIGKGETAVAVDAFAEAADRMSESALRDIMKRFRDAPPTKLSDRVALMRALAGLSSPAARAHLVDLAFPVRAVPRETLFDDYVHYPWLDNNDIEVEVERLRLRISTSDHLNAFSSLVAECGMVITYSGQFSQISGILESCSITIVPIAPEIEKDKTLIAEIFSYLLEEVNVGVIATLFEMMKDDRRRDPRLRLLATGLFVQSCLNHNDYGKIEGLAEGARTADLAAALSVLEDIDPEVAPGFVIGLSNALFAGMRALDLEDEGRARLLMVRRAAILSYRRHLRTFHELAGRPDGLWSAPPDELSPDRPMPPTIGDCVRRLENALLATAALEPEPSPFAEWKERNLGDAYVANSARLIEKLRAKDTTGRWAYYFVLVEDPRSRRFQEAIEGEGIVDLELYGRVVESCYGEGPTQEVKNTLKGKYGFDV